MILEFCAIMTVNITNQELCRLKLKKREKKPDFVSLPDLFTGTEIEKKKKKSQPFNSCHQIQLSNCEILFTGRNKSTIDISVRKTTF